jgi:hypothetical protein
MPNTSATSPSRDFFLGQALCNVLPKEFPVSFTIGGLPMAARTAKEHLEWCVERGVEPTTTAIVRAEYRRLAAQYGVAA